MTTAPTTAFESDLTPPYQTDLSARLNELRLGRGRPLPDGGLDWLSAAFDRWYPRDLPRPFLFATPDGGLQATWAAPPFAPSLDVDLAARSGRWHDAARHGRPRTLDLTRPADWAWVVDRLRQLGTDAARQAATGC